MPTNPRDVERPKRSAFEQLPNKQRALIGQRTSRTTRQPSGPPLPRTRAALALRVAAAIAVVVVLLVLLRFVAG